MKVVSGTRTVGNASKAERPTRYAKGGLKDRMLVQPCPCITGEMKYGKETSKKTSRKA